MTSTPSSKERVCRVLMIDKEKGISSKDVSRILEKTFGKKMKMGHCGTLDPMASGVLPLVLGSATKIQAYLSGSSKTYEFVVQLGSNTDTLDADGETLETKPVQSFNKKQLLQILEGMLGTQEQTPPIYSAKKFKGKPLYWYARNGRIDEVDMDRYKKSIDIYALDLLEIDKSSFKCRVSVSSGTYIRVLGEEIAAATGNLGHLSFLRRTECAGIPVHKCLESSLLPELSREDILAASHCPTNMKIKNLSLMAGISDDDKQALLFGREIPLNPTYLSNLDLAEALDSGKTVEKEWILADINHRPFGLGRTRKVDASDEKTIKLFRGF